MVRWVLTAGHCVEAVDLTRTVWKANGRRIVQSISNPQYGKSPLVNDYGLLKLADPLNTVSYHTKLGEVSGNPITWFPRLQRQPYHKAGGEEFKPVFEKQMFLHGFGINKGYGPDCPDDCLTEVEFQEATCSQPRLVHPSHMCHTGERKHGLKADGCSGDSGGPVTVKRQAAGANEVVYLVGLMSMSQRCGIGMDTVISARLNNMAVQWIQKATNQDVALCDSSLVGKPGVKFLSLDQSFIYDKSSGNERPAVGEASEDAEGRRQAQIATSKRLTCTVEQTKTDFWVQTVKCGSEYPFDVACEHLYLPKAHNCKTHERGGKCDECEDNFAKPNGAKNGKCEAMNCRSHDPVVGTCIDCKWGFALENGICEYRTPGTTGYETETTPGTPGSTDHETTLATKTTTTTTKAVGYGHIVHTDSRSYDKPQKRWGYPFESALKPGLHVMSGILTSRWNYKQGTSQWWDLAYTFSTEKLNLHSSIDVNLIRDRNWTKYGRNWTWDRRPGHLLRRFRSEGKFKSWKCGRWFAFDEVNVEKVDMQVVSHGASWLKEDQCPPGQVLVGLKSITPVDAYNVPKPKGTFCPHRQYQIKCGELRCKRTSFLKTWAAGSVSCVQKCPYGFYAHKKRKEAWQVSWDDEPIMACDKCADNCRECNGPLRQHCLDQEVCGDGCAQCELSPPHRCTQCKYDDLFFSSDGRSCTRECEGGSTLAKCPEGRGGAGVCFLEPHVNVGVAGVINVNWQGGLWPYADIKVTAFPAGVEYTTDYYKPFTKTFDQPNVSFNWRSDVLAEQKLDEKQAMRFLSEVYMEATTPGGCTAKTDVVTYNNSCKCELHSTMALLTDNLGLDKGHFTLDVVVRSFCGETFRVVWKIVDSTDRPVDLRLTGIRGAGKCRSQNQILEHTSSARTIAQPLKGETIEYCLVEENDLMVPGWTNPTTLCLREKLKFWFKATGKVKTSGHGGVANVTIKWSISTANGTVRTDKNGDYTILIWEDIKGEEHELLLEPEYRTYGIDHTFTCPHCDTKTTKCTRKHSAQHLSTLEDVVFIDRSSFSISGKVSVGDTRDYTNGTGDCPLPRARVCPHDRGLVPKVIGECVDTDENGTYSVTLDIGTEVALNVSFSHSKFIAKSVELPWVNFSKEEMFRSHEDIDFLVMDKVNTTLHVSGGLCEHSLADGKIVLEVTMPTFCKNYRRKVMIEAQKVDVTVPMPVSDFQVKLLKLEDNIYSDEMSLLNYFDENKTRKQFVQIFTEPSNASKAGAEVADNTCDQNKCVQHDFDKIEVRFAFRGKLEVNVTFYEYDSRQCDDQTVLLANRDNEIIVKVAEVSGIPERRRRCFNVSDRQVRVEDQITESAPDGAIYENTAACRSYPGCVQDLLHDNKTDKYGFKLPIHPRLNRGRIKHLIFKDPSRPDDFDLDDTTVVVIGETSGVASESVKLSDGNPLLVLYDPPGDSSFATYTGELVFEATHTITTAQDITTGWTAGIGVGFSKDLTQCAGVIVSACTKVADTTFEAETNTVWDKGTTAMNEHVIIRRTRFSIEMSTSGGTATAPGTDQNVVLTHAEALVFQEIDIYNITIKGNKCDVYSNKHKKWGAQIDGLMQTTIHDIKNTIIPGVKTGLAGANAALLDLEEGSENDLERSKNTQLIEKYKTSLRNWENTIEKTNRGSPYLHSAIAYAEDIKCGENKTLCIEYKTFENTSEGVRKEVSSELKNPSEHIFFYGGGQSKTASREYDASQAVSDYEGTVTTIQFSASTMAALNAFGVTASLGGGFTATNFSMKRETKMNAQSGKTTTSFFLSDNDAGDYFDVHVTYDKEYGTPYFKTVGGASMCPHEQKTRPRENPRLTLLPDHDIRDKDPEKSFEVKFQVQNNVSSSLEGIEGQFFISSHNNENGLVITYGGEAIGAGKSARVDYLPQNKWGRHVLVVHGYQNKDAFSYEHYDVIIKLSSTCGDALAETTKRLTVVFNRTCAGSELTFANNNNNNKELYILLADVQLTNKLAVTATVIQKKGALSWADHPKLWSFNAEWRRADDTSPEWTPFDDFDIEYTSLGERKSSFSRELVFPFNYTDPKQNAGKSIDGEYDVRVFSKCKTNNNQSNENRSNIRRVVIDTLAPSEWPLPKKIRGTEKFEIVFSEDIISATAYLHVVVPEIDLSGMANIRCLPHAWQCEAALRDDFLNKMNQSRNASFTLTGVQDLAGNPIKEPIIWEALVTPREALVTTTEVKEADQEKWIVFKPVGDTAETSEKAPTEATLPETTKEATTEVVFKPVGNDEATADEETTEDVGIFMKTIESLDEVGNGISQTAGEAVNKMSDV